jgi:hypothetical protein
MKEAAPPHDVCAGFGFHSNSDGSGDAPLVVCMQKGQAWPCSAGVFKCWDAASDKMNSPPELATFKSWLQDQRKGSKSDADSSDTHKYEYATYRTSGNTLGVYFSRDQMAEANLTWSALQYMQTAYPLFQASWWA